YYSTTNDYHILHYNDDDAHDEHDHDSAADHDYHILDNHDLHYSAAHDNDLVHVEHDIHNGALRHLPHRLGQRGQRERAVQHLHWPVGCRRRWERERLRRGYGQPPHPEVRRGRHLPHHVGKLRLGRRTVRVSLRRGDRRQRARLRRGHRHRPHPEVRRERHLPHHVGGLRPLGDGRAVLHPRWHWHRREWARLCRGYGQRAHPEVRRDRHPPHHVGDLW